MLVGVFCCWWWQQFWNWLLLLLKLFSFLLEFECWWWCLLQVSETFVGLLDNSFWLLLFGLCSAVCDSQGFCDCSFRLGICGLFVNWCTVLAYSLANLELLTGFGLCGFRLCSLVRLVIDCFWNWFAVYGLFSVCYNFAGSLKMLCSFFEFVW